MEILHAKYPFLSSAKESVADSGFDLISTIQTNQPTVNRALERILCAIEEGSIGGFGSHVSQFISEKNLLDNNLKFRSMILPDTFIDHDYYNSYCRQKGDTKIFFLNNKMEKYESNLSR